MFVNILLKFGFLLGQRIEDEKIQNHLKRLGYTYRFVEVDGEPMIVKADLRTDRLDIRLRHGKIIGF